MSITELKTKLFSKEITPEQALEELERPTSRHVGEGDLYSLVTPTVDSGFSTLNHFDLLKMGKPNTFGELVIVGARPGMGKTSFILQLAAHVAKKENVLFISLEMSYTALKARLAAMLSNRGLKNWKQGLVSEDIVQSTDQKIRDLKLFIEERDELEINDLFALTLKQHKKTPLKLVIVDYLQIVSASKEGLRSEEVAKVTKQLKILAKTLGCPVIAAAQLSRACDERGKKMEIFSKTPADYRPIASDIAESSKVERIADVIVFISRQEVYDGTRKNIADVGVVKNRDGETGWCEFEWSGALTKFYDRQYKINSNI